MDPNETIQKTAEYVKQEMSGESTGHDWHHVYRVWKNAVHIGQEEGGLDMFVVQMAALLHDLEDEKITGTDDKSKTKEWMDECGLESAVQEQVLYIIGNMSFKDNIGKRQELSKEGQVVQDADRLDAIGAIGIARAFAYGGKKGRPLYDPDDKPKEHMTKAHYLSSGGNTISHFYEKLLTLKDLLNTDAGRRIAEGRHQFMEEYLDRFYKEWEGKD
jgi:uncharacterized protein